MGPCCDEFGHQVSVEQHNLRVKAESEHQRNPSVPAETVPGGANALLPPQEPQQADADLDEWAEAQEWAEEATPQKGEATQKAAARAEARAAARAARAAEREAKKKAKEAAAAEKALAKAEKAEKARAAADGQNSRYR